jgi:hypothetical protein
MDIDRKIKAELENEAAEIERITLDETGLFGMLRTVYRGSMRRWVIVTAVGAMILTALVVWSAWRFFTAADTADLVFWGVIFVIALNAQVATKTWIWMEIDRSSLLREIKRLELAIERLHAP